MAPIYAAAIGITPQIIDDVKLQNLKDSLTEIKLLVPLHRTYSSSEDVIVPLDIDRLVSLLEPHQEWIFEEQVSSRSFLLFLLPQSMTTTTAQQQRKACCSSSNISLNRPEKMTKILVATG